MNFIIKSHIVLLFFMYSWGTKKTAISGSTARGDHNENGLLLGFLLNLKDSGIFFFYHFLLNAILFIAYDDNLTMFMMIDGTPKTAKTLIVNIKLKKTNCIRCLLKS